MDRFENDQTMNAYFCSLPKLIQESIIQSGISFDTVQQMKDFVTNCEKR